MPQLLVVEPVFAERLWGGSTLRQWFGGAVPEGIIGECWAVSGMEGMSGTIQSGAPEGMTLRDAWTAGLVTGHPESEDFPLLCKFLDPQDWLSVQVHPDDTQALDLEGQPRG
ncbi:MAG: mannose-6-phosphate isomerase, partial [Actinomycetota bacterium]|nr:mannose-6-phosphate isomerase [Actinomycetota bacterium]